MWLTLLIFTLFLSCHRHVKSLKRATGTEYIATSDLHSENALQTFCHGGQVSWICYDESDITINQTLYCLKLGVSLNKEMGSIIIFYVTGSEAQLGHDTLQRGKATHHLGSW